MGNTGYAYDAVGDLLTIHYPCSPDVTVQYDALNRVANMVDAAGTSKYSYTAMSQLLTGDGPFAIAQLVGGHVTQAPSAAGASLVPGSGSQPGGTTGQPAARSAALPGYGGSWTGRSER